MIIRGSSVVFLVFSLFLITQGKKYSDLEKDDKEWQEFKEFQEFQEFQEWKKSKALREKTLIISEGDNGGEENMKLIYDEENRGLDKNYEKSKRKDFDKTKKEENKSMEKSNEKQRWKEKKKEVYQKNKKFDKRKDYEKINQDEGNWQEYENKKNVDETNQDYEIITQDQENSNDPPPINEAALMARYVVNQANWTSVATISSRKDINSFPSANVISFGDGLLGNGSGVPYMYLTPLDFTAQDIFKDSRASLMMTLAQGRYCRNKNYDPMDPRCARVILTGKIKTMKNDSAELEIAKNAVFSRHPWLRNMPPDHHFFFAKLKIASIAMLDTFGGPKFVPVKDYLHPPTPNVTEEFSRFKVRNSFDAEMEESAFDSMNPEVRFV